MEIIEVDTSGAEVRDYLMAHLGHWAVCEGCEKVVPDRLHPRVCPGCSGYKFDMNTFRVRGRILALFGNGKNMIADGIGFRKEVEE